LPAWNGIRAGAFLGSPSEQEDVMALSILTGPTIAAGESLSDGLDCTGGNIVRLTMSEFWTPANMTFQISTDGTLYNDLFRPNGEEVTLVVTPGAAIVVAHIGEYLKAVGYLKLRSGTRDHPVRQAERREFAVAVEVA
jgi:hypothetical protein